MGERETGGSERWDRQGETWGRRALHVIRYFWAIFGLFSAMMALSVHFLEGDGRMRRAGRECERCGAGGGCV